MEATSDEVNVIMRVLGQLQDLPRGACGALPDSLAIVPHGGGIASLQSAPAPIGWTPMPRSSSDLSASALPQTLPDVESERRSKHILNLITKV